MNILTLRQSTLLPILSGGAISLLLFGIVLSTFLITVTPVPDADAVNWDCVLKVIACGVATGAKIALCAANGATSTSCLIATGVAASACAAAAAACAPST
jgi:hypothetical protein